jgi:hypothetical protein
MSRKRGNWAIAVGVALGLQALLGAAEPTWQPIPGEAVPSRIGVSLGRPVSGVTLDRPQPVRGFSGIGPGNAVLPPGVIIRAQAAEEPSPVLSEVPPVGPGSITAVTAPATTTPFNPSAGIPTTSTSGTGAPPVLGGTTDYNAGADINHPIHHGWGDKFHDWFGWGGHHLSFKSDDCFNDVGLISPLTNPFYFEDPRSLTELRPIYIYQAAPRHTPIISGGDVQFFGVQGRLALTENWSIVVNKFGFIHLHADDPAADPLGRFPHDDTGFAEINIGPKWTFYRNAGTGTVAAAGLTFEIPTGSRRVFQDDGSLSIDLYGTVAQHFGRTSYGSFNFIGEAGYNFSIDNERSDFFHASLHLDFDIANAHKWYPLLELNWFHYTSSGNATPFNFEGGDLINFGSRSSGHNYVSLAPGFRYQFNPHFGAGVGVEFPLTRKDIELTRLTFDVILRY